MELQVRLKLKMILIALVPINGNHRKKIALSVIIYGIAFDFIPNKESETKKQSSRTPCRLNDAEFSKCNDVLKRFFVSPPIFFPMGSGCDFKKVFALRQLKRLNFKFVLLISSWKFFFRFCYHYASSRSFSTNRKLPST
jgi:hypothetical protein